MKMNIKLLLALLLFVLSTEVVTGQNTHTSYLILKDSKFKTELYFEGNQSIRVWTSDGAKHVGQLTILGENLIQVGSDKIELSEIVVFKSATKSRKIIGGIMAFGPPVATGIVVGIGVISWGELGIGHLIIAAVGVGVTVVLGPIGAAIGLSKKKDIDEERYSLSIEY